MTDDTHHDEHDDLLEGRLTAAGAADVAPPDELTVARIERDLRAAHGASRRPRVLAPVLAGVAAAVVVVALAGIGDDRRPVDTAGAGRDLAPALTNIPRLPADDPDPADPGERDPADPDPGDDTSATTVPDPASGGDDGAPADGPATTVPGEQTDDTRPTDSRPVDPGPTDTRPTDTRATTTTTAPGEPTPTRLRAGVTARNGSAVIVWDDPDVDVASWSIVRQVEPPEGSLAPAREDVVLKTRDTTVRRYVDDPPERGTVTYVVRGHRADGAVVTRSARLVLER